MDVMCVIDLLTAGAHKKNLACLHHMPMPAETHKRKKISKSGDHPKHITSRQINKREANLEIS